MPVEITILTLGALLLIVHIFTAGHFKTKQYGIEWNTGARDAELPPLNPVAGRLVRAQANFQETFPLAIVALLGVVVAERTSDVTAIAGWIWLVARIAYLPIYGLGIPKLRTAVFLISLAALLVILSRLFG